MASYNSASGAPADGGHSGHPNALPSYPSTRSSRSSLPSGYGMSAGAPAANSSFVTPQHGFYDPGAGYNAAGKTASAPSSYPPARGGTVATTGTAGPANSYGAPSRGAPSRGTPSRGTPSRGAPSYGQSRDSGYRSASRDYSAAGSFPPYGSQSAGGATPKSRYGVGADRYGTSGTNPSGNGQIPNGYTSSSLGTSSSSHMGHGDHSASGSHSAPTAPRYGADSMSGGMGGMTAPSPYTSYGATPTAVPTTGSDSLVGKRYAAAYDTNSSTGSTGRYGSGTYGAMSETPASSAARTGYEPGTTSYNPPNVPSYRAPAGQYGVPSTPNGVNPSYSPGSIDRYRSSGTTTAPYPPAMSAPAS